MRSRRWGYSAQMWEVNSLSRCCSKFRTISSKELPSGAPKGLKAQAHAEQPKPRKRLFSIHISLRLAAITGARQNHGCGCFVSFFPLISLWSAESFMHAGGPPIKPSQLAVSIRHQAECTLRKYWCSVYLWEKAGTYGRGSGRDACP